MEKIKMNLQFFGGRGAGGGDGESLSNSSGKSVNIQNETDVWSFRHNRNNEPFVDAINSSARDMQKDFPDLMKTVNTINATEFGGADKRNTLGVYGQGSVGINTNYTNVDKMNKVYDRAVETGFHPSRGNKSGTEAVTYHELGHALTDNVAQKIGAKDLDSASKKIVNDAYKASGGTGGTKKWAGGISGYAQDSFAECVAEAVADHYCNGSKASKQSKAIMKELKKYR